MGKKACRIPPLFSMSPSPLFDLNSLQVNYLGPILLALLLLPSLMKAPKDFPSPRLVIVGSEAQFFVPSFPEGKSEHILYLLSDKEHCKKYILASLLPSGYFLTSFG